MDTTTDQFISGEKIFENKLTILKDLVTMGLIDGVDVNDAYTSTLFMHKDQNITGYKTINKFKANTVAITDCQHDCKLLDLLKDISYGTARESNEIVNITGTKSFVNGVSVYTDATVKRFVNGLILPDDLLLQGTDQTVFGQVLFTNDVRIEGNVTSSSINGINITDMYNRAMRTTGYQNISGTKVFEGLAIFENDVTVDGLIDSVNLEKDVVLSSEDQTVTGKKMFQADTYIKELYVGSMSAYGLIDGINITELDEELLKLTGHQVVKGTKVFEAHVSFNGNWSIPGLIDGVNITELDQNAMRINGDQTVTGSKVFVLDINFILLGNFLPESYNL